jgi:hypothetical protein
MKYVRFYKAVSGYWFAQFTVRNSNVMRLMPIGRKDEDLQAAIKRYSKKGYTIIP